jgi:selenocysteine lyase/cysteine desulfurase
MPEVAASSLNLGLVAQQWGAKPTDGTIYLNTGSCGRKPRAVMEALESANEHLNANPTLFTFWDEEHLDAARNAAAQLFDVDPKSLLLTSSTTQGLQLVFNSFLAEPGDELVTTDHEHGSLTSIVRYLSESRGIVIKRHIVDPLAGSKALCDGVLDLVNERTRLVAVSEIDCFSGWRPDLSQLNAQLGLQSLPFLVDGAHSPGNGPCRPGQYPLWVGSGHKWLCGPNGTGFLYVRPDLVARLKPVWVADRFYNEYAVPLRRFEFQGTADVGRWLGLAAALRLHLELGADRVADRQRQLWEYLRGRLVELPGCTIRTPATTGETSALLTFTFNPANLTVTDLREHLWQTHKIWTQPDFCYGQQGHGMRISCHVSISEKDIDRLIESLAKVTRR